MIMMTQFWHPLHQVPLKAQSLSWTIYLKIKKNSVEDELDIIAQNQKGIFTVDFTLLYRAVLRSSLGNWVLGYELANNIAKFRM